MYPKSPYFMLLKILSILPRYLYYLNKSLEVIEMIISNVISVLKKCKHILLQQFILTCTIQYIQCFLCIGKPLWPFWSHWIKTGRYIFVFVCFVVFFFWFFSIYFYSLEANYSIVVVFAIHWHESALDLYVFPIPIPPPISLKLGGVFLIASYILTSKAMWRLGNQLQPLL